MSVLYQYIIILLFVCEKQEQRQRNVFMATSLDGSLSFPIFTATLWQTSVFAIFLEKKISHLGPVLFDN